MNFSPRIISSVLEIAKSVRSVTDIVNYVTRVALQTCPEVQQVSEQVCKVIEIPSMVKQMGVKGTDLNNTSFLTGIANKIGQVSGSSEKVNQITNFVSQLSSAGGGAEIFKRVISLQFQINDNTFTEFEQVLETLRTAQKTNPKST